MHSLLENYLAEVAAHLGPLPVKARADELREMRAHLEAAYAAGRERGQAEGEAARDVLAQFGPPGMVGMETIAAWRRSVRLDRRGFWGAAAFGLALLLILPRLLFPLQMAYYRQFAFHPPVGARCMALSWVAIGCLLCGGIVGVVFPRRAVAGAGLAWGLRTAWAISLSASLASHVTLASRAALFTPGSILLDVVCSLLYGSLCLLGAWAVSRWRTGRVQVARG